MPSEPLHAGFIRALWIKRILKLRVHLARTEGAAIHRAKHLDVSNRIEAVLDREALLDETDERGLNRLGFLTLDEVEVRFLRLVSELRHPSLVDPVRVDNDVALGGLTKYLGQPHDRNHAAFNQVRQYHPGTDGWQLNHVSHENEMRIGRNGFQQFVHELHVHH